MKRILAMILCLAMVLVVFLMAGCDKTSRQQHTDAIGHRRDDDTDEAGGYYEWF